MKPIDDGPHSPSKPGVTITIVDGASVPIKGANGTTAIIGINPVRPSCRVCSRDFTARTGLPAKAIVESALVMRDTLTGLYRAICKCHGATYVLELGPSPTEETILGSLTF